MIHKLYASDPRFKPVPFGPGLNIILAERKNESGDKDSRNGIGKTTLINILHFCLGADLKRDLLPVDDILDWVFFLEIDLLGEKVLISRGINDASVVTIDGNTRKLHVNPDYDEDKETFFYKLDDWRTVLGHCLFGIKKSTRTKYIPTFRSLIPYFVRTGANAYTEPFTYLRNQRAWQGQVSNSFLLGLNWEHAADVQDLKDKNAAVQALDKAVKVGIIASKGELEAERVRLQREVEEDEAALSIFQVHSNYQKFQVQADELTKEIHQIVNRNVILKKKLRRYEESVRAEINPDSTTVTGLYEEAGVCFGDQLKNSLADALRFHAEIVTNRKFFLKVEIDEIKSQIDGNNDAIKEVSEKRAELLQVLDTHGALQEFILLQGTISEKRGELEKIKAKITDIKDISKKKKDIKAKRIEIDTKIQRDFELSRRNWEKAIDGFNENSLALYNHPGNLIINTSEKASIKENAYSFDVEIPRSSSEGVGKMKIFCYDLMLVNLFAQENKIDFLVHDSTMFDGVDSRQRAHAIEYAHKNGIENGFQYICAFNSDIIPYDDLSEGFNVDEFICLKLSDQNPADSLLGFHFETTKKKVMRSPLANLERIREERKFSK